MVRGSMFCFWSVLLTLLVKASVTQGKTCTARRLDICFLIDQSSSMESRETYDKLLSFVVKLGSRFAIGQGDVHVSAVIFSDTEGGKTYVYFYLDHLYSKSNFSEKIMSTPWDGGNTRIDVALKLANTRVFTKENGARDDAQKIVFLLTDGRQTNPKRNDPVIQAQALLKRNVHIYAIGVGVSIDQDELNSITGNPSKVFYQSTFDSLLEEEFVKEITEVACKAVPTTPRPIATTTTTTTTTKTTTTTISPPRPVTQCKNRRLDICFVIDQSSSIGSRETFEKMLTFVVQLGSRFTIGKGDAHVSAVIFSDIKDGDSKTYVYFYLDHLYSKSNFSKKIMSTRYDGGDTRIDVALTLANTKVFTKEKGARDEAQKIIFLLTDGRQTQHTLYDPVIPARALRKRGIKIYAIGVTDDIDRQELKNITGDWSRVFFQSTFDDLLNEEFTKNITEAECKSTPLTRSLTTIAPTKAITQDPKCEQRILDICFLIDQSSSIHSKETYDKMLSFVVKLGSRFAISQDNVHVSAIIFSDTVGGKTYVYFYLEHLYTKNNFSEKIMAASWDGGNTRIDEALKLANTKVFTKKHGVREHAQKIIFLLTDGRQSDPKRYDPEVQALALRKRGVKIYAIGVGIEIDRDELNTLTGDPSKVFYQSTFDELLNEDFVVRITEAECKRTPVTQPPTTTTTIAPTKPTGKPCVDKCCDKRECCRGVERCGTCCSGKDVYNIVFHPNSGPNYVFSGMKVYQTSKGGSQIGISVPPKSPRVNVFGTRKQNGFDLAMIVKKARADRQFRNNLVDLLKLLDDNSVIYRRRRRSVNDEKYDTQALNQLIKFANVAGCKKFLTALKRNKLMHKVTDLMKEGKKVVIFCPVDSAYDKIKDHERRNVLLNHIAVKHGKYGTMYSTLSHGKISLTPTRINSFKVSWKANGADVLSSLTDGTGNEIMIINDIISPVNDGMLDFLKRIDNVSIFYQILLKSPLKEIIKSLVIKKVCFAKDICLQVTPSMQEHLKDVITFKQFTILVPTNSMFSNMSKSRLDSLINDPIARREFIQKHIFVGTMGNPSTKNKDVGYSLSPNHSVLTMNIAQDRKMLLDAEDRLFQVLRSLPVTEGLVHIVENMEKGD